MRFPRPVVTLAALVLTALTALLTACASSSAGSPVPIGPTIDPGESAVIKISASHYTVAGSTGGSTITIAGDGTATITETRRQTPPCGTKPADVEVTRTAKVSRAQLAEWLDQAQRDGLLDNPKPGSLVTDSGSLTLSLRAGGRTSTVEVTGLRGENRDPVTAAVLALVAKVEAATAAESGPSPTAQAPGCGSPTG